MSIHITTLFLKAQVVLLIKVRENLIKQFKQISLLNILLMISNLLNSLLIVALFVEMIERRCPDEFKNFMITLSYNIVYIYSKAQILYMRFTTNINEKINNNPTLLKIKTDFKSILNTEPSLIPVEYFKDGDKIFATHNFSSDFAIYSWIDTGKTYINKSIVYGSHIPIKIGDESDIKFMLVEFKFGENNSHKIDLKTEKLNFYIVGNVFTKQFFIYYLKQISKINEEIDENANFSLKIIDQDVNSITLDFTDKNESILLEKTSYKVNIFNHSKSD